MNVHRVVSLAVVLAAGSPGLAMAADNDGVTEVTYVGHTSAKGVCRAVVENDVKGLQRQLAMHRWTLPFAYQYSLRSRGVAGNFTCNDMELLDFADSVGAREVSSYLASGDSAPRQQVSSTDN